MYTKTLGIALLLAVVVVVLGAYTRLSLPYLSLLRPGALLAFASVPLAVSPIRSVIKGASGQELIPVLGATGKLQMAYGASLCIGLALGI